MAFPVHPIAVLQPFPRSWLLTSLDFCLDLLWAWWVSSIYLDFLDPPGSIHLALSVPLRPLCLAFRGTCMSTSPDPELVELALEFEGLSITVRGAPTAATNFVQGLQRGSAHHSAAASTGYQSPTGTGARDGAPSSAASPTPAAFETRDSILASFPACPAAWIGLANQELGSSHKTPAERARRAWTAGNWARAVAQGRVHSPNRSERLELQNRYWCVVRCSNCHTPRVFTSSSDFFRATGPIEGSSTICHAFPSRAEARIYLEAAGCDFPALE